MIPQSRKEARTKTEVSQLRVAISHIDGKNKQFIQIMQGKVTFDEAIVMSAPNIETNLKS